MHLDRFTTRNIFLVATITIIITIIGGLLIGDVSAGFDEGGFGTIVSVVFLALTSVASYRIYKIRRADPSYTTSNQTIIWAIISVGFAFLACDDALEIHENIDKLIHRIAGMTETALSDRIDDVLILVYGILGVGALYKFKNEILCIPGFVSLLKRSFGLMLLQFAIDAFINGQDYIRWLNVPEQSAETVVAWDRTIEETVKLLAVATLFSAMTHALRYVAGTQTSRVSSGVLRP